MEKTTVIEVTDLSAGYWKSGRKKVVLNDLGFTINGGEMVCLAGANGIGKSTLLKTIAGLIPSLSGKIFLKNKLINEYRREETAKLLSIVLTSRIPTGNLRARELVALGRYPYTNWLGFNSKTDEEKINEAIKLTGSEEFQSQPIHELSDGQLQKVLIARALAQNSEIILLDEPTAHLDLLNKIIIMKLLKDLAFKTGKTILIATHELELAMQVSDRLLLLTGNSKIISGTPEDLVLRGTIDDYINHKEIDFNASTGRFTPVRNTGKKINLESNNSITGNWTGNALERSGYSVTLEKSVVKIIAENREKDIIWEIRHPNGAEIVHSIEELLISLNNIF
jgi:iron complex transport system ATP-binding protein